MSKRKAGGFTLVELLVVVSIIALLASMILPSLGIVRELTRMAVCAANLEQMGVAVESYAAASKTQYPHPRHWVTNEAWYSWMNNLNHIKNGTLYPYLQSIDVYICPSYAIVAETSPYNQAPGFYVYREGYDQIVRSYVMNWNVGENRSTSTVNIDGKERRYFPKIKFTTDALRPAEMGSITEESPWWVDDYSRYIVNDGVLVADGYPNQDCFADFHHAPPGKQSGGYAQVVMLDGHVEKKYPWETLEFLVPPKPRK